MEKLYHIKTYIELKVILTTLTSVILSFSVLGQKALKTIILEKDHLLFDVGLNTCNVNQIKSMIDEDFTFYHDQVGITDSKLAFIESIENGICKLPYTVKRSINTDNVSVFPLKKNGVLYGAIQTGEHNFYALEGNNHKYLTSVAKFTHVWILKQDWKLRSGLSYDHKDDSKRKHKEGLFTDIKSTNNWLKQKQIPALGIGFIDDNQINQVSVFGEIEKGKPASLHTYWNVASLTKPIVALLTLKLVNAGLWDLDERLWHYVIDPDVEGDKRHLDLTTRHVLSHQTGLPNWRGNSTDGKLKFEFKPGTKYQYSGEGFDYLRKALEMKFGLQLETLLENWIFSPLKMNNTSLVWKEKFEENFAKWHSAKGEQYKTVKYSKAHAADNLITTIEDYSKFMLHILRGAGLSEELQNEMKADQVRVSPLKHFGLGWWVDEQINEHKDIALVHGGDDIGVHCIAFILPTSKRGLVIFTNSDNGTDAYMDVVNYYLEEDAKGIFKAEMGQ